MNFLQKFFSGAKTDLGVKALAPHGGKLHPQVSPAVNGFNRNRKKQIFLTTQPGLWDLDLFD